MQFRFAFLSRLHCSVFAFDVSGSGGFKMGLILGLAPPQFLSSALLEDVSPVVDKFADMKNRRADVIKT